MSPALTVVARTAKDWTIEAKVSGERVDATNLGESRIDNRNGVATFSFVGINLRPGANTVQLTAIGAGGERGKTSEFKVWGRGAVEKLEIVPSKTEAKTGGLDSVKVEIRGFDRWGNPAADGQISVETSAGRIFTNRVNDELNESGNARSTADNHDGKRRRSGRISRRRNGGHGAFESDFRSARSFYRHQIYGGNAPDFDGRTRRAFGRTQRARDFFDRRRSQLSRTHRLFIIADASSIRIIF